MTNLEIVAKVFTLVGSFLGTIAFLQNISKEVVSVNKETWGKINGLISTNDIQDFKTEVTSRKISVDLINRFNYLHNNIRNNNREFTGFKCVFSCQTKDTLMKFYSAYGRFRDLLLVDGWEIRYDVDEDDNKKDFYWLDKNAFFKSGISDAEGRRNYDKHFDEIEGIAYEIADLYYLLQKHSHKTSFEYLIPWK